MDLGQLADQIKRIDIYTATLHDVRQQLVRVLQRAADGVRH